MNWIVTVFPHGYFGIRYVHRLNTLVPNPHTGKILPRFRGSLVPYGQAAPTGESMTGNPMKNMASIFPAIFPRQSTCPVKKHFHILLKMKSLC